MSEKLPLGVRRFAVGSGLYGPVKNLLDAAWRRRHRRDGSFAQFGEDTEVLSRMGTSGYYADIGANHPFKGSNTYLLYLAGWRGLTIEPIKSHCVHHRSIRPGDVCLNAAAGRSSGSGEFFEMNPTGFSTFDANAAEALVEDRRAVLVGKYEVPIVTLTDAWSASFGDIRPDFVSIDTEGFELEVLAGADLRQLGPTLVLIEFESAVDSGRRTSLVDAMRACGYELIEELGVNGLFRRVLHDGEPVDGTA